MPAPLIEARTVSKSFPGVRALDNVSVAVYPAEVLAVVGENGAGKSTLMKLLAGVYQPDGGELRLDGHAVRFPTPGDALDAGVVLIHQELSLAENLSVLDNLFLGRERTTLGPVGLLARPRMAEEGARALARVGLPTSLLNVRVETLSPGRKQLVEIARALGQKARLLIMDEPTSSLTQSETDTLYGVIDALKADGVAVVYISHRLAEVTRGADRAIVLRDGRNSGELAKGDLTAANMVRLMVGRDLKSLFPRGHHDAGKPGEVRLRVRDLRFAGDHGHPADFEVRAGEVFGMAGLVGAGRTELAEAVFGLREVTSGGVEVDGVPVKIQTPRDAIAAGVLLAPEDRRKHGLIVEDSVGSNLSLPNLPTLSGAGGLIDRRAEDELHQRMISRLGVKTPSARQTVGFLSGGNQQKVVFGKWLARGPKVLILDEPTRGVDVGAKAEIYNLIDELCGQGVAVWVVSSDLEELLGLADRVAVLHEGKLTGTLARSGLNEQAVMTLATGGQL